MERREGVSGGWRRMFIVSPERIEEVRELYESLGFEVRMEKPDPSEFKEECSSCAVKICSECFVVYVRKPGD